MIVWFANCGANHATKNWLLAFPEGQANYIQNGSRPFNMHKHIIHVGCNTQTLDGLIINNKGVVQFILNKNKNGVGKDVSSIWKFSECSQEDPHQYYILWCDFKMSSYTKFLTNMQTKKRKLLEFEVVVLTDESSARP